VFSRCTRAGRCGIRASSRRDRGSAATGSAEEASTRQWPPSWRDRSRAARADWLCARRHQVRRVSHAHIDHTANLERVRGVDVAHARPSATSCGPKQPARQPVVLHTAEEQPIVLLDEDEHDVFGDGQAIIKAAPATRRPSGADPAAGRPPGSSCWAATSITIRRSARSIGHRPTTSSTVQASAASRVTIEEYLRRTKAALWIQHDLARTPSSRVPGLLRVRITVSRVAAARKR